MSTDDLTRQIKCNCAYSPVPVPISHAIFLPDVVGKHVQMERT
jgi:hypothetical protein